MDMTSKKQLRLEKSKIEESTIENLGTKVSQFKIRGIPSWHKEHRALVSIGSSLQPSEDFRVEGREGRS